MVLKIRLLLPYGCARVAGKLRCVLAGMIFTLATAVSVAADEGQTLRLAALGDSLTQGYGLPQDAGLVPQLQDWLQAQGHDVEVLNAGVSGDTTAGGLSRLDWTLADEPDAMMVVLGGNDLLRGIDPAISRENLDAILKRLADEGVPALLVGMPAPGNFGPDFRDDFAAIYPELAREYDVPLYPNLLAPITDRHDSGARVEGLMQDDRIHPNAEGVEQIVEALGPVVARFLDALGEDGGA
ncbi:MAG: lysophospholipase [Rhodobacteraceae bacterium HLUCCA12]|nr:MAG: lysophospholipase [Rhodobacteraceae bacterium HLUCCA12]